MRRYIFAALALTFVLSSCFRDDSERADFSKVDFKIERAEGSSMLTFEPMDGVMPTTYKIECTPMLQYNREINNESIKTPFDDAEYEKYRYRWRISEHAASAGVGDTVFFTIGHERILDTQYEVSPNFNLILLLDMTHIENGTNYTLRWQINLPGNAGPGLLIADERDGVGDLSLLQAYPWLSELEQDGYNKLTNPDEDGNMPAPTIIRNFFSTLNAPLDGVISSIAYAWRNNEPEKTHIDFVVEGKHVIRLDPSTLLEVGRDMALFNKVNPPAVFNPQAIYVNNYPANYNRMVLVNDNQMHSHMTTSILRQQLFLPVVRADESVRIDPNSYVESSANNCQGLFFDYANGQIVFITSNTSQSQYTTFPKSPTPGVFDYDNLAGMHCVYSGIAENKAHTGTKEAPISAIKSLWLLDDGGSRKIYILDVMGDAINEPFTLRGSNIIDMSNCTDFANAKCWANSTLMIHTNWQDPNSRPLYINNMAAEFFYAVGNKIYSTVLDLTSPHSSPTSQVAFEFPVGEEVTLMHWELERFGSIYFSKNDDGNPIRSIVRSNSANNMLTVATHNEGTGEGKIYAIPREFPGTGIFMNKPSVNSEYVFQMGGFGRITAFQKRMEN